MSLSEENDLAHRIIGFAIEIHKSLGPGLAPDAYRSCLMYEIQNAGISAETGKKIPVKYKDVELEAGFVVDVLVENKVVILIESSENIAEYQVQKLLRLLRIGNFKIGLLINFNSALLKDGIRRVTNNKLLEKEMAGSSMAHADRQ